MTTDNLATLIDDSCFDDIFTMQSQTLNDFEFGLEATNIDSLLELFEERERSFDPNCNFSLNNNSNDVHKSNSSVTVKRETNIKISSNDSILISSPKVRKSTISNSTEISSKRKGTSLLAKPKKSPSRKAMINISNCDLQSFSSCFPQDHDYCLISDDNKLYNKLPDYITTFKNVSQDQCLSHKQESDTFDKIPDYIKGFLDFDDDININVDDFLDKNDDNILVELNEAYIEVSDVFFDDKIISNESQIQAYSGDDFNSMSDASNSNSSLTTSAETEDPKRLQQFLNDEHLLPQDIEQNDCKSNNEKKQINRKSRSRSREPRPKSYASSATRRRRRISTRSSVDSSSESSRSSSCSSCSSCTSYSGGNGNESKINYKHSNSIIRNDNKGQQFNKKRSLKEPYCHNNYQRSKIRPNYQNNHNEVVTNKINARNSINMKQDIEERKIIYVGKIPDGTTKTDIRHWFGRFGSIKEVSIHFRDYGDNYAFVTFYRRCDAYEAIEHANDDPRHPKFDLSFGGRRQFCKTRYEDLDYAEDDSSFSSERMDFDSLLRSTQAKLSR